MHSRSGWFWSLSLHSKAPSSVLHLPGYDRLKLMNMLGTLQNCLAQTLW